MIIVKIIFSASGGAMADHLKRKYKILNTKVEIGTYLLLVRVFYLA